MESGYSLRKWFEAAKKGATIKINLDVLTICLQKDIKINTDSILNKNLVHTLPHALCLFMEQWPGWSAESNSTLDEEFEAFKKYLVVNMSYYINQQYDIAAKHEVIRNQSSLTAYKMQIKCPPNLMNGLVFSHEGEHNIIIKHHLGRKLNTLTTMQLLYWPHLEVTFTTEYLSFTRRQVIDYSRFLGFSQIVKQKMSDDMIENVQLNHGLPSDRKCFTLNFLNTYANEYKDVLTKIKQLKYTKFEEIETVLCSFLQDIRDLNQLLSLGIATNTKILMKYGVNLSYTRSKKLIKGSINSKSLEFCEILVPKVEFVLHYCHAEENGTGFGLKFKSNIIKESSSDEIKKIIPTIIYRCTYCKITFSHPTQSKDEILLHFSKEHEMEYPVRCSHCRKEFEITNLTHCRWKHHCVPLVN